MFKRFLAVLTVTCFMFPSIVCAEGTPQFKKSSKGTMYLAKNAAAHGKLYKNKNAMERNTAQHKEINKNQKAMERNTVRHQEVNKNQKAMERNISREKQTHQMLQGTVNE